MQMFMINDVGLLRIFIMTMFMINDVGLLRIFIMTMFMINDVGLLRIFIMTMFMINVLYKRRQTLEDECMNETNLTDFLNFTVI